MARCEILRERTGGMADEGRSILFSSHHTQDAEQISDRIPFIDRGRIIDSMDREMRLDRWRRLRLEAPAGVLGVRREGRWALAAANAFVADLPHAYESGCRRCCPLKRALRSAPGRSAGARSVAGK